jgi:hypothetical protein
VPDPHLERLARRAHAALEKRGSHPASLQPRAASHE